MINKMLLGFFKLVSPSFFYQRRRSYARCTFIITIQFTIWKFLSFSFINTFLFRILTLKIPVWTETKKNFNPQDKPYWDCLKKMLIRRKNVANRVEWWSLKTNFLLTLIHWPRQIHLDSGHNILVLQRKSVVSETLLFLSMLFFESGSWWSARKKLLSLVCNINNLWLSQAHLTLREIPR